VCLTVREFGAADGGSWFTVAAVVTRSSAPRSAWEPGRRFNLERAMRAGDRLGGHIVQGHVDGVGRVRSVERRGDAWLIDVSLPGSSTR
jgi:riboflavin synthase